MEAIFTKIIEEGGAQTIAIAVLGLIAIFYSFERFLHLRRCQIDVQTFMPGIINTIRTQNIKEAVLVCDETPGPAARLVRQALLNCEGTQADMYRAVKEASLFELPRLERHMKALLTITHIAPLLGLLGTITGLMSIFYSMEDASAVMSIELMGPGIARALISSAAGLSVAIPTYLAYNYFRQIIDNVLIEMEKASIEIIYFLTTTPSELKIEALDGRLASLENDTENDIS
ncbi:MAG: MotA/TolQ/ExbB proton channel family protein [Lentisphaeria bacterium]|nr:MotA/TolQ/ExbB proton channel family protein [Lentisphaeria bacterium]